MDFKALFAKIKKPLIVTSIVLGFLGALGVAVFDTYPTYLKKEVALTPSECSQVATLVAVRAYSLQNPGVPIPEGAQKELDEATRLAKRVAKYIIEKSGDSLERANPMFVYMMLAEGCVNSQGKVTLD